MASNFKPWKQELGGDAGLSFGDNSVLSGTAYQYGNVEAIFAHHVQRKVPEKHLKDAAKLLNIDAGRVNSPSVEEVMRFHFESRNRREIRAYNDSCNVPGHYYRLTADVLGIKISEVNKGGS